MFGPFKKIIPLTLFIMMCFCYFAVSCFAGAWTSKKGEAYNKLAFNYYSTDENYDDDGDKEDFPSNGEYKDYNLQYYMEYGITSDITMIFTSYYKYLNKEDDSMESETWGISDVELGLKYNLLDTKMGIVSAQGLVKIPELYDEDDTLPLGNGQYDFEIRMLYGLSLYPKVPGYLNAEIGYRFRTDDPSDEWRYLLEFGMDFGPKTYARIKLDGIKNADNGETLPTIGGNPTLTNNFNLGKLDMALGYKLSKKWSAEVGYTPEIYGENTSAGETYSLSVIYMFGAGE
jgi:protein XagA